MIRVLLVDDQPLLRKGFRMVLDAEDDLEVAGEAADGVEAAAVERDALAHADQAVSAAGDGRLRSGAVVDDLELQ